jgi:hypothetical protein
LSVRAHQCQLGFVATLSHGCHRAGLKHVT